MIHYIFYESEDNFMEVRDIMSHPSRLDMIEVGGLLYQIKERIHSEDKVKLVVGAKEEKKKK